MEKLLTNDGDLLLWENKTTFILNSADFISIKSADSDSTKICKKKISENNDAEIRNNDAEIQNHDVYVVI